MRFKSRTAGLFVLFFVSATFLVFMLSTTSAAQTMSKGAQGKTEKEHAQKSRGGGGPDANIKSDSEKNDPGKQVPAPAAKGGEKTKGSGPGSCAVIFDNRSSWYIRLYIDGAYRGTIAPWGDSYAYTGSGTTQLYAAAVFNDGSSYTWGPRSASCYGTFTWQLFP
jgi:hypothetical protein